MKNKRTSRTLIMLNIAMWSLVIISTCLHYQFNPFSFIWFDVIAPVGHFFAVVFSALSSFTVSMYELFKPETFLGGGMVCNVCRANHLFASLCGFIGIVCW
ncbi:TPA: hypothetical protein ACPOPO_001319 [Haemophilus influenzae]|uniref:hypothetical protein n=1 Tax=Haemophilus influenzae TaxID=727 RepID=UPI000AF88776|nr:hypothetical protein [Haemophilus influenzae]